MTIELPLTPHWSTPAAAPRRPRLLGRQSIFTTDGTRFGCELLYRSVVHRGPTVDTWSPTAQDFATRHVIEAALRLGLVALAGSGPAFVNATRSLLVGALGIDLPPQLGIEVVESVRVDAAVLSGVARLRAAGHLVALDDFSATDDQQRLLPLADVVKVDLRDLTRQGPDLLGKARAHGALTVVERVETVAQLRSCVALGVDLVQGNLLEPTEVLRVPRDDHDLAEATARTARSTA